MPDFQQIPGLSGRIFIGSDAAARRLRNYPSSSSSTSSTQQEQQQRQQLQSPTKCPRCDSSNTKFCYYNNYNLSQPRHFCKSCRRYWTKGGVLRNVPVGGGCRKNSKRSSKSSKSDKDRRKPATAPSGSSSESSSTLTASNPNRRPNPNPNPNLDPILEQEQPMFPDTAASFTSLMAGAVEGFNFSDPGLLPPGFRVSDPEPAVKQKEQQAMDPSPNLDLQGFQAQGKEAGLSGLDWGAGGSVNSGSLFDITSSVDPAVYWNQSHWGDTDPFLYLP